ncbi:MAG: 4Fe-4S dicluster domain-containing protein, partial [Bacteroidota bacterium]
KETTWENIDSEISLKINSMKQSNGSVRFLTGTITSPTIKKLIREFLAQFSDGKHIVYDALSVSAILDAHEKTHSERILPHYRFDKAEVIVSFDADFLGTWISPVEFTAQYSAGRTLQQENTSEKKSPKFSYHAQFESNVSLTGSNADKRIAVAPDEQFSLLHCLAALLSQKANTNNPFGECEPTRCDSTLKDIAERLWNKRGAGLVVCGVNNLDMQIVVNFINNLLGNYGATLDIQQPSYQRQGNDRALAMLQQEINDGKISGLFISGCNPVYDTPNGDAFGKSLKNISLVVSFAERVDETSSFAHYVCPDHHSLESWNDAEIFDGVYTMTQPTIQPFGNTRALSESISNWSGAKLSAYAILRNYWQSNIFPQQKKFTLFQSLWDATVEKGFFDAEKKSEKNFSFDTNGCNQTNTTVSQLSENDLRLVLYPTIALLDGRHAHNPWLQELPDPVTKIVWDNYASISSSTAERFKIEEGTILNITSDDGKEILALPAHIQPGLNKNTVAIALGYGRKGTERFTNIGPEWLEAKPTVNPGSVVGKNAAKFLQFENSQLKFSGRKVSLTSTGEIYTLASTQIHHSLSVPENVAPSGENRREIIQETSLEEFSMNPAAGSFAKTPPITMWNDDHKYTGHHWGMAIDLTACTGCSACVISCQAENNTPSVGKDEVFRNRELTWLRIDRYYEENNDEIKVAHQPMMCQHCGNAPCETVCPVLATVHSSEGLNQQVYNRCVGTRYCANNCPYKVRRFNWFEYEHGDAMHKLVLNPDVTVRERGVMEKCTMCVQRIQEGKILAKKEGRILNDGEIQPACQQSCPANAIVFGDMNDKQSKIASIMKDPRYYRALEEIGVQPAVGYLTLVHDRENNEGEKHNG